MADIVDDYWSMGDLKAVAKKHKITQERVRQKVNASDTAENRIFNICELALLNASDARRLRILAKLMERIQV